MQNAILRNFARTDPEAFARFSCRLEPVTLTRGAVLGIARSRTDYVYFVESGVISVLATTRAGGSLDVAIIGSEGVAGIADALGQNPLPYGWVVQLPGTAFRLPTVILREHILSCSDLHELLMAYSQLVMHQLAQSAVCNCFHTVPQRLARWLLLVSERAGTKQLEVTHEVLAQMVGAPRSAVTQAAARFRRAGLIAYQRGVLKIRSVNGLHQVACECFDSIARAMDRQEDLSTPS
jgi:CRP-like cAMP-binding protein